MDSGCGQTILSASDAVQNGRQCTIEIEGVASTMMVNTIGTAFLLIEADDGRWHVGEVHECLQGGGQHDLLSVSQVQDRDGNRCDTSTNVNPTVTFDGVTFPLELRDGLYGLKYTPLSENDPRIELLPHVRMIEFVGIMRRCGGDVI